MADNSVSSLGGGGGYHGIIHQLILTSVVDPNTLNLDPDLDKKCWNNLDPDPGLCLMVSIW